MNKIILMGNLCKDVELTHVGADKTAKASCSVATNERVKGENKATFHNLVIWGKRGEAFAQYMRKGSKVLVEGKQMHESYEKDGEKKFFSFVNVSDWHFIDKREDLPAAQGGASAPQADDIPF